MNCKLIVPTKSTRIPALMMHTNRKLSGVLRDNRDFSKFLYIRKNIGKINSLLREARIINSTILIRLTWLDISQKDLTTFISWTYWLSDKLVGFKWIYLTKDKQYLLNYRNRIYKHDYIRVENIKPKFYQTIIDCMVNYNYLDWYVGKLTNIYVTRENILNKLKYIFTIYRYPLHYKKIVKLLKRYFKAIYDPIYIERKIKKFWITHTWEGFYFIPIYDARSSKT